MNQVSAVYIFCGLFCSTLFGQSDTTPPFKVLFGNDTTNITTCVSPYRSKGQRLDESMIRATVEETAGIGVDIQLIQPGTIWTPWWQSKIYSMKEHYDWYEGRYGIKPDSNQFNQFVYNGGDVVQTFVDECLKQKIAPFISVRLNDGHFLETWNDDPPKGDAPAHCLSKFYVEHVPQYCVGYGKNKEIDFKNWDDRVQDWAIPEVRAYKYSLIKELCENYNIAGLELDFMRHRSHFNLVNTTAEQRRKIMTKFIKDIRKLLDDTSKQGQHRWLCVRIPCYMSLFDRSGIEIKAFAYAGVDMFNLSPFYFTVHDADIEKVVKLAGKKAVYLEMCHTTYTGKTVAKGYDNFTFRRTTPIQYYTAAHLAYSRGAYGTSTFNFVYYREHGNGERGPFNEPPFEVFSHISNADWVSRQPQDYVLANTWLSKYSDTKMPFEFNQAGDVHKFNMDMAPVKGGWTKDGKLRIQADGDLGDAVFTANANGVELEITEDVSEPYSNPYSPLLGDATVHRGWIVPKDILKDGLNTFEITMRKGQGCKVNFIDLAIE